MNKETLQRMQEIKDFVETVKELERSYLAHNDRFKGNMVLILARMNVDLISFMQLIVKPNLTPVDRLACDIFEEKWNRDLYRLITGLSFIPKHTPDETPVDSEFIEQAAKYINTICGKVPT